MSREAQQDGIHGSVRWEYFIDANTKGASRLFDELCRGLASVVRRLEPANDIDLSPKRLANFYRTCGGDFDELFRNTSKQGVSFLYRTLGCYHSLQPTPDAFEYPSIPCLTDDGYVRWQTLQLLLCPAEHARLIQRAAEIYDIPRRDGSLFPKTIPRECFPVRPDADMEKWHRFVTSQMNQDNHMRRLKFSPYQSPQVENTSSPGGYFPRAPAVRRPSHSRHTDSASEEEIRRMEAVRRRSSVPDIVSPGGTSYKEKDPTTLRSHSANRLGTKGNHQRMRSYTSAATPQYSPSEQRSSQSSISAEQYKRRDRNNKHDRNHSSGSHPDSSQDSSSDESYRPSKRKVPEDNKRKSRWGPSFMPSFFLSSNKRRHSSDGRVPTISDDQESPRRSNSIRKYKTEGPGHPQGRLLDPPPDRQHNGGRFGSIFNGGDPPPRPEEPMYPPPPTSYRYSESQANTYVPPHMSNMNGLGVNYGSPMSSERPDSFSPVSHVNGNFETRKPSLPIRVAPVSGVNGRRYAPQDPRNPIEAGPRRERTSSMRNPITSTVM